MNVIDYDKSILNLIQKSKSFCLISLQFICFSLPLMTYGQSLRLDNKSNNLTESNINSETEVTELVESSKAINSSRFQYKLEGKNILIDARKPIAGNGDTASSLFLIQNIIANGYQGIIDILSDDRSEKIMKTIAYQLPNFWEHVRIIKSPNETTKIYDLVFRSGQPSGRILIDQLSLIQDSSSTVHDKMNIAKNAVFVSTPIYGNSTNPNSIQPNSVIKTNDHYKTFPAPGLNSFRDINQIDYNLSDYKNNNVNFNESGIFHDPFSLAIRNMNLYQVEDFILHNSEGLSKDIHQLFQKTFRYSKANSIGYTLAYGFSIGQVRSQALNYFRSLLALPQGTIVITPSIFSPELLASFSENEKQMISVKNLEQIKMEGFRFPNKKLVVIQIPNIPHHLFSALLLASYHKRRVPLGAGDGFFTTALSLGIPFAPTAVDWNLRNIRSLGLLLQMQAHQLNDIDGQLSIEKIFPIDPTQSTQLLYSQNMIHHADYFRKSIQIIPNLYRSLMNEVKLQSELAQFAHGHTNLYNSSFLSKYIAGSNPEFTSRYCAFVFK